MCQIFFTIVSVKRASYLEYRHRYVDIFVISFFIPMLIIFLLIIDLLTTYTHGIYKVTRIPPGLQEKLTFAAKCHNSLWPEAAAVTKKRDSGDLRFSAFLLLSLFI